ncbi:MAG: NAD(P)H-dependent oxidoreductase subunit E [Planctomycetales bacterium]|nr:NAD(P)H-dependent oxidoreductase subunit E [Planctomycetales bacterium]
MKQNRNGEKEHSRQGAFAGFAKTGGMLGQSPNHVRHLLPILQRTQCEQARIMQDDIAAAASEQNVSSAEAYGVATFYSMLEVTSDAAKQPQTTVRICDSPTCVMLGANHLLDRVSDKNACGRTSCLGLCDQAPAAIYQNRLLANVKADSFNTEIDHDSHQHQPILQLRKSGPLTKDIGSLDPDSFASACEHGVYQAAKVAVSQEPRDIIQQVEHAGLRGCGGAGFLTGHKWQMVAAQPAEHRYVVCNADESEPGTFKDRLLMLGNPHLLLEGMLICALAVNAQEGVIYIRGEYEDAAQRLEQAIAQAVQANALGKHVFGSNRSFHVHVHRGAGAYICGEETALLESLEGKRGEPRSRPPYPTVAGYRQQPTVVNNVETLCSVPGILQHGAAAYRDLGSNGLPGTKLYCLSGNVAKPGVYEMPMATTSRQLIQLAGGVTGGDFYFALTGGAAGTFISQAQLDMPLGFDAGKAGVSMGSGAVIVANQRVRACDTLLSVLNFFAAESCGKCTPCRIGSRQAAEIASRITNGTFNANDIQRLRELAKLLDETSFCGLGRSIAWPIESALERFPHEFSVAGADV